MARRGGGGTRATEVLAGAGVAFTVHTYEQQPAAGSYGLEAAAAMGVDGGRVFKTLLVTLDDGSTAVAIVPVGGSLDLKSAASALGAKRATMADPDLAERLTGYVRGGISPLGQRRRLPTILDETAWRHGTIFVSGGKRGLEIELAPEDLARLTGAEKVAIGRRAS